MAKNADVQSGVPMMITSAMERRMREAGLGQSEIDKMTPQQAHTYLQEHDQGAIAARSELVNERMRARARHRSPNYPFINLEKAIERTRQIYDADRRHEVPVKVVSEKRWEYKPGSSQGDQTLGALRAFGLVEVAGSGDKRMVKISDRAYRILASAQDAPERIKDAALSPTLHGELWQKYGTDGLPSDDVIRNYLLFERPGGRFNEDVVDSFIGRFKETISFAKLDSSDKLRGAVLGGLDEEKPEYEVDVVMNSDVTQVHPKQNPPPAVGVGQKDFPLYLSNNKRAILYVPATMTAKDYELLKRQIENHLLVIEATSISEDEAKN